jgi:hypothetical protein
MEDDKDDKSIIEKTLEAVKDVAGVASEVTHEAMEPNYKAGRRGRRDADDGYWPYGRSAIILARWFVGRSRRASTRCWMH